MALLELCGGLSGCQVTHPPTYPPTHPCFSTQPKATQTIRPPIHLNHLNHPPTLWSPSHPYHPPTHPPTQLNEKQAVGWMLEREMRQEKNLELRERDLRRAKAAEEGGGGGGGGGGNGGGGGGVVGAGGWVGGKGEENMEELLRKVDTDFLSMIKEAENDGE